MNDMRIAEDAMKIEFEDWLNQYRLNQNGEYPTRLDIYTYAYEKGINDTLDKLGMTNG